MTARSIISSLQDYAFQGENARSAAQAGFLEWVFGLPTTSCPQDAAKTALNQITPHAHWSQASLYFWEYLQQTAVAPHSAAIRKGGIRRRRTTLH